MTSRLKNKKWTLESDEEDDPEPMKNLGHDDYIEGQEESYVDIEDNIRFTPCNMREEIEEGLCYKDGTCVIGKKKDEIVDNWIEDVNWFEVKKIEKALKEKKEREAKEQDEVVEENIDDNEILKSMLEVMAPKETVTMAIKRLGKMSGSTSAWHKKKKAKLSLEDDSGEMTDSSKSKQQLLDLIGHADKLLSKGMFNIYQETHESIAYKLSKTSGLSKSVAASDDLDIFGSGEPTAAKQPTAGSEPVEHPNIVPDDVMWQFKWTNTADAEVYGPYSSEQMLQWQEDGYFKDEVFVRKSSECSGEFYNARRIDFGLYL